jgi:hypothetical protein
MSLNWSILSVRDHEAVNFNPLKPEEIHPVLHYLIFACIPVGMSGITEKNKVKFFERISIYQRMCGPAIKFAGGVQVYVTMEDIERYVGLSTNVSNETDAWFFKNVRRWALDSWYEINKDANEGDSAMEYIEKRALAAQAVKEDQHV